jgi:hypothetical protein
LKKIPKQWGQVKAPIYVISGLIPFVSLSTGRTIWRFFPAYKAVSIYIKMIKVVPGAIKFLPGDFAISILVKSANKIFT